MNATSARPVAIITGAAHGIGRACALALGASGFNVLLADIEAGADGSLRDVTREAGELGVDAAAIIAASRSSICRRA